MPIEHNKQTIVKETISGTLSKDEILDILITHFKNQNINLSKEDFEFYVSFDNVGDDSLYFDGIIINKEIELTTQ